MKTVSALVKTLVMMAGEIEYENFIYENGDAIFPFTGHFMILLFVVLISIILMNLLVGLAVSDIQVRIRKKRLHINCFLYIYFPNNFICRAFKRVQGWTDW